MENAAEQTSKKSWWKEKIRKILLWVPLLIWKFVTRLYYRIQFYLIQKWRVKDFAFINYWVLGILIAVLGILYVLLNKAPFYLLLFQAFTELAYLLKICFGQ